MSVTTTRAADRHSVGGAAGVVGGVVGAARSSDGRVFVGASLVTMAGVSAMSSTRKSGSGANRDRRAGCPWLSISKPYHDSWHLQPLIARSRVRLSRFSRCAARNPFCGLPFALCQAGFHAPPERRLDTPAEAPAHRLEAHAQLRR